MPDDHPDPEELARRQREEERAARQALEEADSETEAQKLKRRADKAHYLQEKLREQEQADQQ